MSKSKTNTTRRRLVRAGLATSAATALFAAATASPAFAVAGTLALSQSTGPVNGGNTIVATLATNPTTPNPTAFTSTSAVLFVAPVGTATASCPATYPTVAPSATMVVSGSPNLKLLGPSKLAIVVPTGLSVVNTKYAVCSYATANSGALLIAGSSYTVGTPPTIAAVNGLIPVSGPAQGGTTITVTGSGFVANTTAAPNNTTATLDGLPLTNINVAGGGGSFTAITPAHAPGGPFTLTVTTPGGTVNNLAGTTTKASMFNYTNGITISPNTAPNTNGSADLDILGVGFANFTFDTTNGNTPDSGTAHVYLTSGAYNATGASTSTTGVKTNPEKTECINVLVIADTELLCSLPLNHTFDTSAALVVGPVARTAAVVTTSGSKTITSANASFTQADVGLPINNSGDTNSTFPANTTIASVQSPTSATLSANAGYTNNPALASTSIGGPLLLASATGSTTSNKLTAVSPPVSQAAVGRIVTSAANLTLPANTTVTAVSADGATITLSATPTATAQATATDVSITPSVPVTNGTYTITVVNNGAPYANIQDPDFLPTIISSGSTFTVADY
ncbi:IPT/TIG domain-containing protein [Actinoplanes sp. NPDC051411]|uniref:IPT/TIG domain-containing protein n=1 Tax=Actinoplanes sp. NPDC051411 TaxID=3155522 RepID=UPI00341C13AD